MQYRRNPTAILLFLFLLIGKTPAEPFPDQHHVMCIDSIFACIETVSGIKPDSLKKCIRLEDGVSAGFITFKPQDAPHPFNRGLPSWNGAAADENCSFMVQMRFGYGDGWSPWLTVGFWKAYIWSSYGATSYAGGEVDYDYIKLNEYQHRWQFGIKMKRTSPDLPSPTLHKLSFFMSDSRTTNSIDFNAIINDDPEEIFIPTDFLYQYAIDDQIGGSICSPTSVCMVLRSFDIEVDPLQFALDTRDPYYGIFGIWPRVVQNASEYGLDGAVTRYRSWSSAREVLANGGRIVMSVGPPLYGGHLMMLAGFTDTGTPLVHDPAKSDGYAYQFNKSDLSYSWFDKGGIAYTFYPADSQQVSIPDKFPVGTSAENFRLFQNYPNPFNPTTVISWRLAVGSEVKLTILNITGQMVATLVDERLPAGVHSAEWDASRLASGVYLYRLEVGNQPEVKKMILMK